VSLSYTPPPIHTARTALIYTIPGLGSTNLPGVVAPPPPPPSSSIPSDPLFPCSVTGKSPLSLYPRNNILHLPSLSSLVVLIILQPLSHFPPPVPANAQNIEPHSRQPLIIFRDGTPPAPFRPDIPTTRRRMRRLIPSSRFTAGFPTVDDGDVEVGVDLQVFDLFAHAC